LDGYKYAGYRVVQFPEETKLALREIAGRLIPDGAAILDGWIERQWEAWEPPGLTRDDLRQVFGEMLSRILKCMRAQRPEDALAELEEYGAVLAGKQFPFEALIVSVHFLEETYLERLLIDADQTRGLLVAMDEFLHAALAALATSYFRAYRRELLDQAEVGRIVQEGLSAKIPRKAADIEIASIYISAREQAQVGGDFLDYFEIPGKGMSFLVGDLSGHGVEAAADSSMLRSVFRGFMRENPDPADAMTRLNRVLDADLKAGKFATAVSITYDPAGHVDLVSAGHPFPILCEDGKCILLEAKGIPLAVLKHERYTGARFDLKPGALLVAYTDGIIEAKRERELYGEERLVEAISERYGESARTVAEHVVDDAHRFADGKFDDDVAILVLRRLPPTS
jgi:serine phosphatase RsbU (regulator of sigma subunit)